MQNIYDDNLDPRTGYDPYYQSKLIGKAATYEGASEEAVECAQSALVAGRVAKGTNTSITPEEAGAHLMEEFTDTVQMLAALGYTAEIQDVSTMTVKPWSDMYEDLAEICLKISHLTAKSARRIRGENPTPATEKELCDMLREEYQKMRNLTARLGLTVNKRQMWEKQQRFKERYQQQKAKEEQQW